MIFRIYKIRDERVGTFGTPIFINKEAQDFRDDYKASIELLKANAERYQEAELEGEFMKAVGNLTQLKDCAVYSCGYYDGDTGAFTLAQDKLEFRMVDLADFSIKVDSAKLPKIPDQVKIAEMEDSHE